MTTAPPAASGGPAESSTPAPRRCPSCGATVERPQRFCVTCGRRLSEQYRRAPSWRWTLIAATVFLVAIGVAAGFGIGALTDSGKNKRGSAVAPVTASTVPAATTPPAEAPTPAVTTPPAATAPQTPTVPSAATTPGKTPSTPAARPSTTLPAAKAPAATTPTTKR